MKTVLIVAVVLSALSGSGQGTVPELCPPEVGLGWTNGWVAAWTRDVPGLQVSDSVVRESADRIRVVRRWTWTGNSRIDRHLICPRGCGTISNMKEYLNILT